LAEQIELTHHECRDGGGYRLGQGEPAAMNLFK
jgi:hypothetical protein